MRVVDFPPFDETPIRQDPAIRQLQLAGRVEFSRHLQLAARILAAHADFDTIDQALEIMDALQSCRRQGQSHDQIMGTLHGHRPERTGIPGVQPTARH